MEVNNYEDRAKVIAFYLPQFSPNPFNNKWYGEGFTEWTNVGKAKPLFRGHNQPRVPADLGYYDLRVPEVVEQQAKMAKEAGVSGFAYWHYWWSGDMELHEPAERMLKSEAPDFPFCFAWANENWYKKLWTKDKNDDILLKDQQYPGAEDNLKHFEYCLPFFKDKRYITFDGRPIFMVYRPTAFPGVKEFIIQWNELIKASGVADSFYFIGMQFNHGEIDKLFDMGFDCVSPQHNLRTMMSGESTSSTIRNYFNAFKGKIGKLRMYDYANYPNTVWNESIDSKENIAPQIIPNWDNTPRAGHRGLIYKNATPKLFEMACQKLFAGVEKKKNRLVFLKSWNEWAEGNYMEPDIQYGHDFLKALRNALDHK